VEHRLVGLVRLIALLVRLSCWSSDRWVGVERSRWVWAGLGALLGPEGTGESLVLLLRAIWGRANRSASGLLREGRGRAGAGGTWVRRP
jgi:hypothetical protein